MEFSRPEYWSGQPFPSPRDLPDPGIEPRSPALQVDSLPAELSGKAKMKVAQSKILSKLQNFRLGHVLACVVISSELSNYRLTDSTSSEVLSPPCLILQVHFSPQPFFQGT